MGNITIVLFISALLISVTYADESTVERLLDQSDLVSSSSRTVYNLGYGVRTFREDQFKKHDYKAAELGIGIEFFSKKRLSTTSKLNLAIGIKKDQKGTISQYDQRYYNLSYSQSINVNFDYGTFMIQPFIGGALSYNYYANVLNINSKIEDKQYEVFELTTGGSYEYFAGINFIFEKISPYIVYGINYFKPEFFELSNLKGRTQKLSVNSQTGSTLEGAESSSTSYIMAGFSFTF
jgi:hypothetical protein